MKEIIDGRMYNTDTAKWLASYNNGLGATDFRVYEETLYRKKTGEYFLHGSGGAMSKYSRAVGNSWCGSEEIIPLSKNLAKKWTEDHCTADTYIEIFGEVEE